MEQTTIQLMIEYLNGLLDIEDKMIILYSNNQKAVEDIKKNWQQLNNIKTVAIQLLEKKSRL